MYVAVKGGEAAIEAAHDLLARARRGDPGVPELSVAQIRAQLSIAVDRVMCEGSLYDRDLAALAIKQARGDMIEASFLLRAYRTTLPRFGSSLPIETRNLQARRRISATFKDLPGGQVLGPTFDYTHRLLDPSLLSPSRQDAPTEGCGDGGGSVALSTGTPGADGLSTQAADRPAANGEQPEVRDTPRVLAILEAQGLVERPPMDGPLDERDRATPDLTREPLEFPADRALRLQNLARADEGLLLALGYSTQRGYGRTHPFAGEIRMGEVEVFFVPEELGFEVPLGELTITECEMVNQFKGSADAPPQFTRGYGLVFGHSERKAMAMALVDRSLRATELGEEIIAPAQDQEFVLSHSDNVQATGFVEHLKLPHYVDFQAELTLVRQLQAEWRAERQSLAGSASTHVAAEDPALEGDDAR
ncbi:MAG: carbon-phosphorus lyase complex subunit PhnI [Hyphomicrobiaceae bacterium]